MTNLPETIPASISSQARQGTWAASLDRLAFAFLILLALTFAFEAPLGGKIAGEATLTTDKVLQVLVIGSWLASRRLARTPLQTPRQLILPVLLWLAALLVSTVFAPASFSHTIRFLSRIVQGLLLAWVAYDLVNTVKRWQILIRVLIGAGVIVALLGLGESVGLPLVLNFLRLFRDTQTHVGDVVRVSSSLGYATIAAMVLEMLIPLTAAWTVTAQSWALKALLELALIVDVGAMMLTLTRSAVFGLSIALIVVIASSLRRHRRNNALAAFGVMGVVFVGIALLVVTNPIVGLRLLSENENAWYQARYSAPTEITAHPNDLVNVPVQLTNAGLRNWQARITPLFRLGFTLTRANDPTFKALDGPRTELPADVPPGQTVTVIAQIPVPETPGEYRVQWDMVEETVLWFSWRGSIPSSTRLIVAGDFIVGAPRPELEPANHSSDAPPVERPVLWGAAMAMFRANPLFGVGPDNFRWIYGNYLSLTRWDTNIHANSIYLEWLADTGLIGLLAFLWLNGRWLQFAWQRLNRQADLDFWVWQLALIASLTAWFVHGFLDNFFEFAGTYILFWLIAGLAINPSLYRLRSTDESAR